MRSIFLVLGAVAYASEECQIADEATMLQAGLRGRKAKQTGGDALASLRRIASSMTEKSTFKVGRTEVDAAIESARQALETISPTIYGQVTQAQTQINDAGAAVDVCHAQSGYDARDALEQQVSVKEGELEACQQQLATLVQAAADQCAIAQDCLCDEATVARDDQQLLCDSKTVVYELAYCEHNLACSTFGSCHEQEMAVYNDLRASVEVEMASVTQEYITVQQSSCLMALIQTAIAAGQPIDSAAMLACNNVDTTAMTIVYPSLPGAPAACPAANLGNPQCAGQIPSLVFFDQAASALTATEGALTGAGQLNWNTAANSAHEVSQGDNVCGISFKCDTAASHLMIGLVDNTVTSWPNINFGVTCRGAWAPALDLYESGSHAYRLNGRTANGSPTTDVYAIRVNAGGNVEYSLNGEVIYTSSRTISYPWHVGLDTYTAPSLADVTYLQC